MKVSGGSAGKGKGGGFCVLCLWVPPIDPSISLNCSGHSVSSFPEPEGVQGQGMWPGVPGSIQGSGLGPLEALALMVPFAHSLNELMPQRLQGQA